MLRYNIEYHRFTKSISPLKIYQNMAIDISFNYYIQRTSLKQFFTQ